MFPWRRGNIHKQYWHNDGNYVQNWVKPDISSFHLTRGCVDKYTTTQQILEAAGRFACLVNPIRLKHKDRPKLIAQNNTGVGTTKWIDLFNWCFVSCWKWERLAANKSPVWWRNIKSTFCLFNDRLKKTFFTHKTNDKQKLIPIVFIQNYLTLPSKFDFVLSK